jgi:hypothetical protein
MCRTSHGDQLTVASFKSLMGIPIVLVILVSREEYAALGEIRIFELEFVKDPNFPAQIQPQLPVRVEAWIFVFPRWWASKRHHVIWCFIIFIESRRVNFNKLA